MHPSITKKPFFCNYWITYKCNSKCGYCNFWSDKTLQKMQDAEFCDVKKNLDDLKRRAVMN